MSAPVSRRRTRLHPAVRLRRIAAALAAVTAGLLAWAAAVPAASAAPSLIPDPGGAPVFATPPAAPVQVITAAACPAGRSLSSRSPPPWSRPPPRYSWTAPGPAAGPPPPLDDTPACQCGTPAAPRPRPSSRRGRARQPATHGNPTRPVAQHQKPRSAPVTDQARVAVQNGLRARPEPSADHPS